MIFVASIYIAVGLAITGVAVPMARRRVRPNYLYGFRTPRTLRDPRIWYDANEYCGRMLVRAGIVTAASAILLLPVALVSEQAYALSCLAVTLASNIVAIVASFRHLRTLP